MSRQFGDFMSTTVLFLWQNDGENQRNLPAHVSFALGETSGPLPFKISSRPEPGRTNRNRRYEDFFSSFLHFLWVVWKSDGLIIYMQLLIVLYVRNIGGIKSYSKLRSQHNQCKQLLYNYDGLGTVVWKKTVTFCWKIIGSDGKMSKSRQKTSAMIYCRSRRQRNTFTIILSQKNSCEIIKIPKLPRQTVDVPYKFWLQIPHNQAYAILIRYRWLYANSGFWNLLNSQLEAFFLLSEHATQTSHVWRLSY